MATGTNGITSVAFMTPREVAAAFRCDTATVKRWARNGALHCVRTPGGRRLYYADEINAMMRGETWEPPGGWPGTSPARTS